MKKVVGSVLIVLMLVASAATSHAWYHYANAEKIVWEEIAVEGETFSAGTVISALPNGARSVTIEGTQYFISGGNWFLPVVSKEGVQFQVVFAPL